MADAEIQTSMSRIWLGSDGIIRQINAPGTIIDVERSREALAAFRQAGGEGPKLIYTDITGIVSADAGSRRFGVSEEYTREVKAMGLRGGSAVSRMIGNFFMRLNRPPYPTRLFATEEQAVAWLETFREG